MRRSLTVCLCLAAAFAAPAKGLVFCFGQNGHVALERAHSVQPCLGCDSADDEKGPLSLPAESSTDLLTAADDCSCFDLPIAGADLDRMNRVKASNQTESAFDPVALFSFTPKITIKLASARQERRVRPTLSAAHLRSVILLI